MLITSAIYDLRFVQPPLRIEAKLLMGRNVVLAEGHTILMESTIFLSFHHMVFVQL